ncbi:F-box only protein 32-like isoform X1 [Crassostrea virginica]
MEASSRGNNYVKKNGVWKIVNLDYYPGSLPDEADEKKKIVNGARYEKSVSTQIVSDRSNYRDLPLPILRNIQGTGIQRKTHESISSALEKLKFEEYASQYRQLNYCREFYRLLVKQKFSKISGTVQKRVGVVLEQMTSTAIALEQFIPPMRQTLREICECLRENEREMIGSKAMRRKNNDLINNCSLRLNNFDFTEKEDDGTLCLMDLPKECLINIMKKLDQPRDVINVSLTCSSLEVIAMDNEVWESMCFHHFNDKEITNFVGHMEFYSVQWLDVFKFCFKKSKVRKTYCYGDELVVCDNCRGVYWRRVGHDCPVVEVPPSFTVLSPADFLHLLNL